MSSAHTKRWFLALQPPTAFVIKATISCMAGCRRWSDPSAACYSTAIRKPSAGNSAPLALKVERGHVGGRGEQEEGEYVHVRVSVWEVVWYDGYDPLQRTWEMLAESSSPFDFCTFVQIRARPGRTTLRRAWTSGRNVAAGPVWQNLQHRQGHVFASDILQSKRAPQTHAHCHYTLKPVMPIQGAQINK